ncbi:MAG: hypothetical protein ACFFB5_24020 [Promethearchaeota archaeon]
MKELISDNLERFMKYYQQTLLKRFIVGIVAGLTLWFGIFITVIILDLVINDIIWWDTFLNDLPLIGAILALIVSLQIWGLLPQPASTDEQNIEIESSDRKYIDSEEIIYEDSSS